MSIFFYKHLNKENNYRLYQFLFQELVWCKCSYAIRDLQNSLTLQKLEIIALKKNEESKFKSSFKSAIYSTAIPGVYIVLFLVLDNGDMIYLINNCFIHVSIYYSRIFKYNPRIIGLISQCKERLNYFTYFNYISIYPCGNTSIEYDFSKVEFQDCYLKNYSVKE